MFSERIGRYRRYHVENQCGVYVGEVFLDTLSAFYSIQLDENHGFLRFDVGYEAILLMVLFRMQQDFFEPNWLKEGF